MPTVHHTPYLQKPPLYAWVTTALARRAGDLDEQIARLPSAVSGTLFVLLMYTLGRRWIGADGGLAAAAFTLMNATVLDYAVRAELDLPFSFFCALNMALTLTAVRARGFNASVLWILAYAAALVASMWKGPHVLIFMWLTLLAFGWRTRSWHFLKTPAQWIGMTATLGILAWWTQALSAFAGAAAVGRAAAIELLVRLTPYQPIHLLEFVTFLPLLLLITLPASAFLLLSFRRDVRAACGLSIAPHAAPGLWPALLAWWRSLWSHPHTRLMLLWMMPTLLFMLWAPAKSPRYTIPLFPPIILLATFVVVRLDAGDAPARQYATAIWRGVFGLLAAAGLFGAVRLVAGWTGRDFGLGSAEAWEPWVFLVAGGLAPLAIDVLRGGGWMLRTRLIVTLAAVLAIQPVLHDVIWPLRVQADTQRSVAQQIDATVPTGARLYVLGDHEYHDSAIYARTPFQFVESADAALAAAGGAQAYAICRAQEADELIAGATAVCDVLFHFDRLGKDNICILVHPPAATVESTVEPSNAHPPHR